MNTENPYAPPRAKVSDVVEDTEELELAGRAVRLGAAILDGIVGALFIGVPFGIGMAFSMGRSNGSEFPGVAILLCLIGAAVWAWLNILYVSRNGQSVAKKWLGIKVVRTDGSKASLGRIFWLRNFVNGLLGVIPFYSWIDPLLIFSDSRQCVHDKIADTIVVVA